MIVALIISIVGFVIGLTVMVCSTLCCWKSWIFLVGDATMVVSVAVMLSIAAYRDSVIRQNSPKEYPASEYTFKIKVVESEEQRDTILVNSKGEINMKAPNKIWLSKFEEDPGDNEYGIFEQWSLEPISNAENEEYIRKGALLEYAKDSRDSAGKLSYTEFIEKIELL